MPLGTKAFSVALSLTCLKQWSVFMFYRFPAPQFGCALASHTRT